MASAAPADLIGQHAARRQDEAFVTEVSGDRVVTWAEHVALRNRLASTLRKRGFHEGGVVVCYGHNSHEWVLIRTTCHLLSCYFVPMNWHLAAPEVAYIVDDCGASAIFVDAAFGPLLQAARTAAPKLFARIEHVMVWGGDGRGDGVGEPLSSLLEEGDAAFPDVAAVAFRAMIYTGGTSGKPKAVMNRGGPPASQEQAERAAKNFAAMMGPEGLNIVHPKWRQVVPAPLYHSAPLGFMTIALNVGMPLVLLRTFDAVVFLHAVDKYSATNCIMPPILVKRICDVPDAKRRQYNISSLTSVVCVGAACPMPVKEAALRSGLPLHEFYGSSELGLNTALQPADMLRKPGSCGRIAKGVEMRIIGEDGLECPRGTPGLLYIQSPLEYHNAEQKTKDAQLPADPTFCTVGDIAYVDEEDFVFICDRKIDMIISGGANVYPAEVEDCLFRHPAVADAAVFGVPDAEYGERVHAALLLKDGHSTCAEEIQAFAREHIAGFKIPRAVSFHSDFPRTPSGKILKRELRDQVASPASKL